MITITRNGKVTAKVQGPLFIGPCIIPEESDTILCAVSGVDYHIFISDRNGNGRTEIY